MRSCCAGDSEHQTLQKAGGRLPLRAKYQSRSVSEIDVRNCTKIVRFPERNLVGLPGEQTFSIL
jgi:hypothetical protein